MKTFNRALLGATALSAIAGMAFAADTNEATTSQNGNNNALLIQQGNSGVYATTGNLAGSATHAITQDGNNNDIDILQVYTHQNAGWDNRVGTGIGSGSAQGVDQLGNNNKLDIEQRGSRNLIHDVQQNGGNAPTANSADIKQVGSLNYVSNIDQDFNGNASKAANTITIDQNGSNGIGNTSTGPRPDGTGITQTGNGNSADIVQDGSNKLRILDQSGDGGGGMSNGFVLNQIGSGNNVHSVIQVNRGAAANKATIDQNGQGNGKRLITGFPGAGGSTGLSMSTVYQYGQGNDLDYDATGMDNTFAFSQTGDFNDIDAVSNGVNNELAILQIGDNNVANANQQGNDNQIGAVMDGHRNKLNMQQAGAGSNVIQVAIDGNDNNNHGPTPLFSGDAFAARNVARNEGGMFTLFSQRDLFQNGHNNSMSLDVTGNANAFAMAQNGDDNTITGTITHGSMNQAVVAQVSSNNSATFTIGGTGNNTGIIQN